MSNVRVTNLTGQQGGTVINDSTPTSAGTVANPKYWQAIQVINDAEIASLTAAAGMPTNADDLTGVPIAAGTVLYGRFSAITLTSGLVVAYLE